MKPGDALQEAADLALALAIVRHLRREEMGADHVGIHILTRVESRILARQIALADELLARE